MGIAPGARKRCSTRPMIAITANTIATTSTENAAAGPSDSSVMFSSIFTVIRVQLIETRKIVALIAVIGQVLRLFRAPGAMPMTSLLGG